MQTITIELPESLYRSAQHLSRATKRPLATILEESLHHTLPPLDDVPPAEAESLAQLSSLSDADLWRVAQTGLTPAEQVELATLLDDQSAETADAAGLARLTVLQEAYGQSLVRQAHAWLLLARRGYKVPVQTA